MKTATLLALVITALVDVVVALRVLRPGRGPDLRSVRAAALATALLTLVEVAVLVPTIDLTVFGIMHLAWLDLAVVVPACGIAVLVGGRRARRQGARDTATRADGKPMAVASLGGVDDEALLADATASSRAPGVTPPPLAPRVALAVAWLSLLMVPIAAKAMWLDPRDLRVERVTVPVNPARAGSAPLVVGVLADLQTTRIGPHEEAAVDRLMEGAPDLILVPGDLFQGPSDVFFEVLPDFHRLLGRLHAPGGVWVVPGNTDYRDGLRTLLEGTGARLLVDASTTVRVKDRVVTIHGVDETNLRPGVLADARFDTAKLAAFETAPGDEDIRLVLAHRPRVVSSLAPDTRVDLVVAGHTHGGQVAFPWIGPPIVLSPLPNRVAAGGLHALDGRRLYISRGVGMERFQAPRVRFLVPPEVTLLMFEDAPATPD